MATPTTPTPQPTTQKLGSYNQNFLKGILEQDNPYTYGFGGEKVYEQLKPTVAPGTTTSSTNSGLLANTDPGVFDPTNKLWGNYGFKTNTADRQAIESGDYSKVANPDGLSQDVLHFLYKKGGVMNLYGVNEFLRLRGDSQRVRSADEAAQVLAPYIAKRKQTGLKSSLGGILGSVLPIAANFIPVVGPFISAGLGVAQGVASGNPIGALTSLLGLPGVGGAAASAIGASGLGGVLGNSAQGVLANRLGGDVVGNLIKLQGYSEGGKVSGQGDGMSDGILTTINGSQPAALSDGEHVVPALQVALLGRGSSDAGSKKVKDLILKEISTMYGDEVDPVSMQKKAMKKVKTKNG